MANRRTSSGPSTPIQIGRRFAAERAQARDPAAWGVDRAQLELPANADVDAQLDSAGRPIRVRRNDIFALMRGRGRISGEALIAVRRLQDDVAALHGTRSGGSNFAPRVDVSRRGGDIHGWRLRAGARVAAALGLAGAASARLLTALLEADVVLGKPSDWRTIVARETGETLADAQGAILRVACENLAGAYAALARANNPQKEG